MANSQESPPWRLSPIFSLSFVMALVFAFLAASPAVADAKLNSSLALNNPSAAAGNMLFAVKAAEASGGDFSCSPDRPCSNGACCGSSGWCGYGPKYCGDGCQSHCDARAECGEYAMKPGLSCPLNVCCSRYGFCGTTSEFCGTGCQSHCDQPKPSLSPSNVQKRVIGYWEAWNHQHACGTMSIGEIPVSYLTHLNVAFGYIDSSFRITNMDGLSSDIYRDIGQVKLRNPGLKIMIALGGWTFSDPGPWQSVFPTMVSSQSNRATFIKNLLGFFSEYGYDGVDFDWEYPGAEDRGGSKEDGVNYTALLEELREAIKASGRNYLVTFTAPTSYWYLRHFDIKNMAEQVDWINLMSYDLHGVWDSSNPIGNHVLSHTNLTEIDLALDLFWRVNVDPSSIVLGIGFYGRSFQLTDPSCWKPGCRFSGPGAAGKCTSTPGILSYREIKQILQSTGATSYLDKEAAARYMVYDNNNWISYDDAHTIKAKIEFANKMGLSGVMTWALDLDDSALESLKALSDPDSLDNVVDGDFDLVDLKCLFPDEDLPPEGAKPKYGLVTFGGSGSMDPGSSAFGFLLIAGDSHVVSNLKRRSGQPEPFEFLDCPKNTTSRPTDETQVARVVCFAHDLEGCFAVQERGVEGTIVEMPDNSVPEEFANLKRTSQVFDFKYDFNFKLTRRDSNNTSVRMDYSNLASYWKTVVDSPGIQARNLEPTSLETRYFAPTNIDWEKLYDEESITFDPNELAAVKEDLSAPIFWQTAEDCSIAGDTYTEGLAAYVTGKVDANFYYGFSLIGKLAGDKFDAKQSHGFIQVHGNQDVTFGVAGIGNIDAGKAGKGNPAVVENNKVSLKGHTINTGHIRGSVTFDPYYQIGYELVTINGSDYSSSTKAGPAPFDGRMSARVVTDYGKFLAKFPLDKENPAPNLHGDKREKNKIELGSDNILYGSTGDGGVIGISTSVTFGLSVDFSILGPLYHWDLGLPRLSLTYNTMALFVSEPSSDSACSSLVVSAAIGWDDIKLTANLVGDSQIPAQAGLAAAGNDSEHSTLSATDVVTPAKRSNENGMPGWGFLPGSSINPYDIVGIGGNGVFGGNGDSSKLPCINCIDCKGNDSSRGGCCGCVNMAWKWGRRGDMPDCPECDNGNPDDRSWVDYIRFPDFGPKERDLGLEKRKPRAVNRYSKKVTVCGTAQTDNFALGSPYQYPGFPNDNQKAWDGILNGKYDPISRYWGNSSSSCALWGVRGLAKADTTWVNNAGVVKEVRAPYATEHVYEGQLIGDFFSQWLDNGQVRNQDPPPKNPKQKVPCSWTDRWAKVADPSYPWNILGLGGNSIKSASFVQSILSELGSDTHLDRLTIMLSRPNEKKGSLFTGIRTVDYNKYLKMSADEQLQTVKDLGIIFNYLNSQTVWEAFCGTYEAIWKQMGQFDDWYTKNARGGPVIPSLQKEWKEYNQVLLSSVVRRARAQFDFFYQSRRASGHAPKWLLNQFVNRSQIKLSLTCPNLDKIQI
ncbi:hypothetical protein NHJ13734_009626 [Beauveria thailandica]